MAERYDWDDLYRRLLNRQITEWKTRQVIGVDWYDGWRLGFVMFEEPIACFVFEMNAYCTSPTTVSMFKMYEFSQELFLPLEALLKIDAEARGEDPEDEVLFFSVNSPNQKELDRLYEEIMTARVLMPFMVECNDGFSYDKPTRLWRTYSFLVQGTFASPD